MAEMRIDDALCLLDEEDLEHVKIAFPEAPRVRYFLPYYFESVINFERRESLAVHLDHFKNGLRFPLHPFMVEVMRAFGMIPSWLTPKSIGYLVSFIIKAREADLRPTLSSFQSVYQLINKGTWYFSFKPRPGYCPIHVPQSPDIWKQRFVLVSSNDWDKFQPHRIPNPLDPTPSHLLSENDKWMLTVCDTSVGTVPHFHAVVTLENLTVQHPRGTWAELRALYGENVQLNGHPTLYEISLSEDEDEEEEREADDEYSDEGERDDTDLKKILHACGLA
ncbi:hypothetical protein Dimus_039612 [Dionaea muscipula]